MLMIIRAHRYILYEDRNSLRKDRMYGALRTYAVLPACWLQSDTLAFN
jgi:hypothetical protein